MVQSSTQRTALAEEEAAAAAPLPANPVSMAEPQAATVPAAAEEAALVPEALHLVRPVPARKASSSSPTETN
jgi:hypothetical protein